MQPTWHRFAPHRADVVEKWRELTRVAASIRRSFTPRSTYRASCRRRNSTSACSDWRD